MRVKVISKKLELKPLFLSRICLELNLLDFLEGFGEVCRVGGVAWVVGRTFTALAVHEKIDNESR